MNLSDCTDKIDVQEQIDGEWVPHSFGIRAYIQQGDGEAIITCPRNHGLSTGMRVLHGEITLTADKVSHGGKWTILECS